MPKMPKLGDHLLGWAIENIIGIDIEDLKAKQEAALRKGDPKKATGKPQQLVYHNLMFTATTTRLASKERVNGSGESSDPSFKTARVDHTPSSYKSGSKLSGWKIPLAENVDVENPDVAFQLILDYATEELERAELALLHATNGLEEADDDHDAADQDRERAFSNKRRIMRAQGGCDTGDKELVAKLKHMRFDAEERVRHAMKVEREMDSKLRAAEDVYEAAKREKAIALLNKTNAEELMQEWLERKASAEASDSASSTTYIYSRTATGSSESAASSPTPQPRGRGKGKPRQRRSEVIRSESTNAGMNVVHGGE